MNGNGADDADPGVANWQVTVSGTNGLGQAVGPITKNTDGAGNYAFTGLTPGHYTVSESPMLGWQQTFPPSGSYPVTLTSGQNVTGRDFGNEQTTGSIAGRKFEDLNANGPDPSDPPVEGWPIELTGTDGGGHVITPIDVLTDASGNYIFTNLLPGTYALTEGTRPGWAQSWPVPVPPGTYDGVHVVSGEAKTGYDFGNYQFATISGQKYEDRNLDGSNDGGTDPGVPGFVIHLDGTDGLGDAVHMVTTTDAAGDYLFSSVVPSLGDYVLTEEPQPGWSPIEGSPERDVPVQSGDNITGQDFGNWRHATATALKYEDTNGNGMQNPGELGLSGWTIHLHGTDDFGATVDLDAVTDGSGIATFADLVPGHYTLTEVLQPGWVAIEPPSGFQTADPVSNDDIGPLPFGNYVPAEVHGLKFQDINDNGAQDPGDPTLSGWTITLTGTTGLGVPVGPLSTVTGPDGTYAFIGLAPGQYAVCEVNPDTVVWAETKPGIDGTCYDLTLTSHEVSTGNDFGNFNKTINPTKDPALGQIFETDGTQTFTFDEVLSNQLDPNGLGGFAFDLHYDPTVFQQPNIDLSPAVALFAAAGRTLDCSISILGNGIDHVACASSGTIGVGPQWAGPQILAHVTLTPLEIVTEQVRPNKENGVVSPVKDTGMALTNTCGQPLNDGSIQPVPGQPECQGMPLVGVGPGGVMPDSMTTVTLRRLEGDVTKDCAVDVSDMQAESSRFGMSIGNVLYNVFFDVNLPLQHGDGEIDINDVQFIYGRFGSTCAAPIPAQGPQALP